MTVDVRARLGLRALERAIELFAPSWALRRSLARYHLRAVSGFSAINDQSRRLRQAQMSPTEELQAGREALVAIARNLDRNNSYARGAFQSITGNVIGRGIRAESNLTKQNGPNRGQPDQMANRRVEAVWDQFARGVDLTGVQTFSELQRQAYYERWVTNDVFVVRHVVRGRRVPLALEVVPSEQLPDDETSALFNGVPSGNTVIQGIEFTPSGEIAAYHFLVETPETKKLGIQMNTTRIPAARVLHIFKPHRPGAVRGLSPVSSVSQSFEALATYLNHELTRAGISAAFVFLHKRGGAAIGGLQTGQASDQADSQGNPMVSVEGGTIINGTMNDSIEGVGPTIANTAFDPFVTLVLRSIATALGISYELLARDFTKTNFSSARQSSLEDRRHWEPEQDFVNDRLNQPVWDWFVADAMDVGALPRRTTYPVLWMPQGWQWIDPLKQANATEKAIDLGLDSAVKAAARLGGDVYENLEQTAAVEAFKKDIGLTASAGGNDDDDTDSEEEGEAGSTEDGGPRIAAL